MMRGNVPSKKKVAFPVGKALNTYLKKYGRAIDLPLQYEDMSRYFTTVPLIDSKGVDTYWETVIYHESEANEINLACCQLYALLKTDGDMQVIEHLEVDRIDICMFGNTNPYRVRIINRLNDNYDHFYIKRDDASRVYGLELEYLLSPNNLLFLFDGKTIVEEHVAGVPGDKFMIDQLEVSVFEKTRIAKEFVKFNERCFIRLLGDMRSYNYIFDITPDIEENQYRIRAIDFDQQSYEGRKNFYLPQYFKNNRAIVNLGIEHLSVASVMQYQLEERSLIARRARASMDRLKELLLCMSNDRISTPDKVKSLAKELASHHKTKLYADCKTMGEIITVSLRLLLAKEFKQSFYLTD